MSAGVPIALTIAGSDSSGGAGIQADLKTFTTLGVYGASVVTALTAQNTRGVQAVEVPSAAFVVRQIDSVLADLRVDAAKTGMLANREIVGAVASRLAGTRIPLVVDPVMIATSGDALLTPDAVAAVRDELMPLAALVTPNLAEAARLLGAAVAATVEEAMQQASALAERAGVPVLVKGGHGGGGDAVDVLVAGAQQLTFSRPRVDTRHTHGTGCTLSAAIAAGIARGLTLEGAVAEAKTYVWQGLEAGKTLGVGGGNGPVDHLHGIRDRITVRHH